MAHSNANPLLKSWLIVGLFWYFVLYLFADDARLSEFSTTLGRGIFIVFIGICTGVLANAIIVMWLKGNAAWVMNGDTRHGATITLGRLPEAPRLRIRKWWQLHRGDSVFKALPWFDNYAECYPAHAGAFKAVYDLLQEAPNHPVTTASEGHGNLTLLKHSLGVVAMMIAQAPHWKYVGHRNRKGEVTIPLTDPTQPYHAFAPDDPLLPLAALAHDIGKLTCYARQADGTYAAVKKFHDIEGAKILRGIPEVRAIPFDDWTALILAVEYYHHLSDLPRSAWLTDRMRSLAELLLYVDQEASRQEGRSVDPSTAAVSDTTNAPLPFIPALPESDDKGMPAANPGDAEADEEEQSEALPVVVAHAPATSPTVAVSNEDQPTALDLTAAALRAANSVNGKNANDRIAYKFDDFLYITEDRLRKAVAANTNDKSYLAPAPKGLLHPFVVELIQQLNAEGMIKHECGTGPLDPKRALYDTSAHVPDKPTRSTSGVLIVKTAAFPWTTNIQNCQVKPAIAVGGAPSTGGELPSPIYSKVTTTQDTMARQQKTGPTPSGGETLGDRIRRRAIAMEIPYIERSDAEKTIFAITVDALTHHEPEFDETALPEGMSLINGGTSRYVAFRVK